MSVALRGLAAKGIVHGDLSRGNVMIVEEKTPSTRRTGLLIDFGYSRQVGSVAALSVGV